MRARHLHAPEARTQPMGDEMQRSELGKWSNPDSRVALARPMRGWTDPHCDACRPTARASRDSLIAEFGHLERSFRPRLDDSSRVLKDRLRPLSRAPERPLASRGLGTRLEGPLLYYFHAQTWTMAERAFRPRMCPKGLEAGGRPDPRSRGGPPGTLPGGPERSPPPGDPVARAGPERRPWGRLGWCRCCCAFRGAEPGAK